MALYIPIAGTWARHEDRPHAWYRRNSEVDKLFRKLGYARVEQDSDPSQPDLGYWSGDVGGLLAQGSGGQVVWWEGGNDLRWLLERRRSRYAKVPLTIIGHSHGGQVGAFALGGLDPQVPWDITFVTIDMPVRRGMRRVYKAARRNARRWIHLHTKWYTRMRLLGSQLVGPVRLDIADRNIEIFGGHSGIVSDPRHTSQWRDILPTP